MGGKLVLKYENGSSSKLFILLRNFIVIFARKAEKYFIFSDKNQPMFGDFVKKMWCNIRHILNVWIHQCLVNGRNIWLSRKKIHSNHTWERVGKPIAALAFSINVQFKYEFIFQCQISNRIKTIGRKIEFETKLSDCVGERGIQYWELR